MNPLFVLFVAELFALGLMWHNKSARPELDRESEKPDPAVLFSERNRKHTVIQANLKRCSADTESTAHASSQVSLPPDFSAVHAPLISRPL